MSVADHGEEASKAGARNAVAVVEAPRQARSTRTLLVIAGAAVTALVTLAFFLVFWNRFAGLRSGDGGFSGAVFLLNGILPSRDYYSTIPPFYVAHCAAALAIFGKLPIVLRGLGMVERLLLGVLLYAWLVRFFRIKNAALAAMVTMVVSAGDNTDPVASYNHFTILLATAAGYVSSFALDEQRMARARTLLGCASGVLAALCLASKQTIGIGVTVAIPLLMWLCLLRLQGRRDALGYMAGFAGGWVAMMAALAGLLAHFGMLRPLLVQAFVTGPAAKAAHLGDYWIRTLHELKLFWWEAGIAMILLAISWVAIRRAEGERKADSEAGTIHGLVVALAIGVGAIGASLPMRPWFQAGLAAKPEIYLSFLGSTLLMAFYFWLYLARRLTRRQAQFALLATVSFVIAFMLSLSFPAFEAMAVPGLGLFLAALLESFEGYGRWVTCTACAVLLFCQTQAKMDIPFEFEGWYEPPVRFATETSSLPEMKGFVLPQNTISFLDTSVRIIRENSTPQDTIFVFPEIGILYGLSDRRPATFSLSHNIDVVSDDFARQEAERLLRAHPAVLIYDPAREVITRQEEFWRNGKPSGVRILADAVESLAQQYQYLGEFRLYPLNHPVYVFVRPGNAVGAEQ